ncbi:hypothetical protein M569_08126, partial [Genlisea aurea]
NQGRIMLSGQSQRNVDPTGNQMQNPNLHCNGLSAEPDIDKARRFMLQKIFDFLMQRHRQTHDIPNKKIADIVRRLEEGLFKCAGSKEEYLNLATLETRLQYLLTKRTPVNNHNQQFSHASSSVSVGTMIPTPGFQQNGNSSSMGISSVEGSVVSSGSMMASGDSGGFLLTRNGPSRRPVSGGYEQSSSMFPVNIAGDNAAAAVGIQKMTYQMIPTPGIRNQDGNANYDDNASNFPAVEQSSGLQPLPQNLNVSNPNNISSQNINAALMRGGVRSMMQKPLVGALNGGLGMMRNSVHIANGMGTSEMHLPGAAYGNLTRQLYQPFDQRQRNLLKGDGHGFGAVNDSGSGSLYVPVTSSGLTLNNNQSLNTLPVTSSPMESNYQTGLLSSLPVATMKPQFVEHSEQMNSSLQYPVEGNSVECLQNIQPQHHSQFPHQQLAHQVQLKQQLLNQQLKNISFGRSQSFSSNLPEMKSEIKIEHADALNQFHQKSLHSQKIAVNPQTDFTGSIDCIQQDVSAGSHQNKNSENVRGSERRLLEKSINDEFHRRLTGQDTAQQNILSSEESINFQSDASRAAYPRSSSASVCQSNAKGLEQQYRDQVKWLLFLRHARHCPAPKVKCHGKHCLSFKKLLKHVQQCNALKCDLTHCYRTKHLINHNKQCREPSCPVCIPVKNFLQARLAASSCSVSNGGLPSSVRGSYNSNEAAQSVGGPLTKIENADKKEDIQPPTKRQKTDQGSLPIASEDRNTVMVFANDCIVKDEQNAGLHDETLDSLKSKITEVIVEIPNAGGQGPKNVKMNDNSDSTCLINDSVSLNNDSGACQQKLIKAEKEMGQAIPPGTAVHPENASKSSKQKVNGVSMIELFTPEQVHQHIRGLRQWVGQSKAKAEKNQAMGYSMNENSCQLCALEKLSFE